MRLSPALACSALLLSTLAACQPTESAEKPVSQETPKAPPPPVLVDGSSTVGPLTRSVLDLYASELVTDIQLEVSGTGGGFKKFCRKQTAINGASRPISLTEAKLCEDNGVKFIELPVAFDGVAVVVPRSNDWLESLTQSELRKIWQPAAEGVVRTWKDVRTSFPSTALELVGPGLDSGTFDFFTQAIVGQEGSSRSDYFASEKDTVITEKIASAPGGLGYYGLAHAVKNKERLRIIPIDDEDAENGTGAIFPSRETVSEGSYQPLSRPIFIYVSVEASSRKEVTDFVAFYLRAARLVAGDIGYIPLPVHAFELARQRFENKIAGSVFPEGRSIVGISITDLLEAETVAVQTGHHD